MADADILLSAGRDLKMVAGAYYIPKKNKSKPLGEDAYFISDGVQTIGVADGVGGWARKGIDSGVFARELMANAEFEVENQPILSDVNPLEVLELAFLNTTAPGSSTACIVSLSGNLLRAANVGDSGFVVIRNGVTVYQSPSQQSEFNTPYQLGRHLTDCLSSAEELAVEVEPGDVVILGSDGLFDNVFDVEIEEIVNASLEDYEVLDKMAWKIAEFARERSVEAKIFTPFTKASFAAGKDFYGGKYDDITVIAAYIELADLKRHFLPPSPPG